MPRTVGELGFALLNPTYVATEFSASHRSGEAPLTVQFTDISQPSTEDAQIISWDWDFGDSGAKSDVQNPAHTYNRPGTFTVSLEVTASNAGSDFKSSTLAPLNIIFASIQRTFSPTDNTLAIFNASSPLKSIFPRKPCLQTYPPSLLSIEQRSQSIKLTSSVKYAEFSFGRYDRIVVDITTKKTLKIEIESHVI